MRLAAHDLEHIVNFRIDIAVSHLLCTVGKAAHHFLLRFAGFQHLIDVLCFWHRQIQHIRSLYVCGLLEQ